MMQGMYRTKNIKTPKIPICVDFDGVIHAYRRGFADGSIYDEPMPGTAQALRELRKRYFVYVMSTRTKDGAGRTAVLRYLKKHKIPFDKVVAYKPPAKAYIDDRALRFVTWSQTLRDLKKLRRVLKGL
ncbi:MAG: hypothetical protein KGI73_04560 [Patescibacteria group bacterium]|nr:hypothetical protein [Patescibacteria group bacterium]